MYSEEDRKKFVFADGVGYIRLLDFMGGDNDIVDRARVCYRSQDRKSEEADAKLLTRLVGSKPLHGTTLRGTVMSFDVVLPLFCMRQWTRHLAGHDYFGFFEDVWSSGTDDISLAGAFDEMSFRYVDAIQKDLPAYVPDAQERLGGNTELETSWKVATQQAILLYEHFRKGGVEKGLARVFLPQSMYTQMVWTCNLQAFFDWYHKRMAGGGAQWEITQYADKAMELVSTFVAPKACQAFYESKGV